MQTERRHHLNGTMRLLKPVDPPRRQAKLENNSPTSFSVRKTREDPATPMISWPTVGPPEEYSSLRPKGVTRRQTAPPPAAAPIFDASLYRLGDSERLCMLGQTDDVSAVPITRLPPIEEGTEPVGSASCEGIELSPPSPSAPAKDISGKPTGSASSFEPLSPLSAETTISGTITPTKMKPKTVQGDGHKSASVQRQSTRPVTEGGKSKRSPQPNPWAGVRRETMPPMVKPTTSDTASCPDTASGGATPPLKTAKGTPGLDGSLLATTTTTTGLSSSKIYSATDRRLLTGCRVHTAGEPFTARSKLTAVVLRPPSDSDVDPEQEQRPTEWNPRFVILGGTCTEDQETGTSSYYEAEFTEDMVLGHRSLEWRKEELSPPIETLSGHSAIALSGIDSDKFVIFGGSGASSLFGSIYVVDASTRLTYASSTMGQQPASRTEHSCCLVDSILYVFGGRVLKPAQQQLPLSSSPMGEKPLRGDSSTPRAAATGGASCPTASPTAVSSSGTTVASRSTAHHQHWHLLQPCKVFRDLWKLDLRDFEWVRVPLQPEPGTHPLSSPPPPGTNGTEFGATVTLSKSNELDALERVPRGRAGHCAMTWDSACYIMGGFDGESVLEDIWRLSVTTEKWRQCTPRGRHSGPRYGAASAVCGDLWLIHGGVSDAAVILNDFVVTDLVTWSTSRVRVDVHRNPARLLPSLAFHTAVPIPLPDALRTGSSPTPPPAIVLFGGYGKSGAQSNAVYTVMPSKAAADAVVEDASRRTLLASFLPPPGGDSPQNSNPSHKEGTPPSVVVATRGVTQPLPRRMEGSTESCASCAAYNHQLGEIQSQSAYLADRLSEQKAENLALRGTNRRRSARRHPLLGRIIQSCLDALAADETRRRERRDQIIQKKKIQPAPTAAGDDMELGSAAESQSAGATSVNGASCVFKNSDLFFRQLP